MLLCKEEFIQQYILARAGIIPEGMDGEVVALAALATWNTIVNYIKKDRKDDEKESEE